MPELQEVLGGTAECDVTIQGVTVHLTYRPGEYTPEAVASFRNASKDDKGQIVAFEETLKAFVLRLVTDWDITVKGKKLPLTMTSLNSIPVAWLDEMVSKINEDMAGKRKANS